MNPERERFLNLKTTPARLNAEETAWFLGFNPHDIPVLVGAGLLKPLGNPNENSSKFFALVTLREICGDAKWLGRATNAMMQHWRRKNAAKVDLMCAAQPLVGGCTETRVA